MTTRINSLASYLCVALLLCIASVVHAQQRPLITEDVDIIPPESIRIEAGIDFMQGAKYTVSGLGGDLTRVGVIGINIGMGPNVEFQIEGVAQNYLSINSRGPSSFPLELAPGANSSNDTGDFTLAAKFKLRNETRRGPSLGFRFGVQPSRMRAERRQAFPITTGISLPQLLTVWPQVLQQRGTSVSLTMRLETALQ